MGRNPKKLLILTMLVSLLQMALFCGAAYGADLSIDVEVDKYIDNTGSYPDGYSDAELENMMAVGHDNMYGDETAVLRFDLSGIAKDVGSAKLKIYILERHAVGGEPFITVSGSSDDEWTEDSTEIPAGASLTSEDISTGDVGGWKEFDVTAFVAAEAAGDDTATFVLNGATSGNQVDIFSYDRAKAGYGAKLEITYANNAPTLGPIGDQTISEGSELTFTASASDEDLNDLTYSLVGAPIGAVIDPDTGDFSWTPAEAQGPGDHTFTVKVTDDGTPNLSDSEEITVTVSEVNTAPVLGAIGNKTVDEGSELTFTAGTTDADLPANTLTYSLEGTVPDGATINGSTGVFSWTPTEAQGGSSYTFTVKVTDNGTGSLTDEEEITVTVAKVNNAPVLAAIGNQTANEGSALTFTALGTDVDIPADTRTYSLEGTVPDGATINDSTGEFSWSPTEAQGPGSYTFTVRVTDSGGLFDSEEITVTVSEVNTAPMLAVIGNKTVDEGTELNFTALGTDVDIPAGTLTYSLEGTPSGAAINGSTGEFSWTPTEAQGPGSYTFTVKVTDSGSPSLSDSEEITVTVNEVNTAPVLAAIGNQTVNEGSELAFTASATDEDLPANSLTYSLEGTVPAGAGINASTGVFSWTPAEAQGGSSYTFTVKVTDNGTGSLTDEEEITVTVAKVNNAPVLAAIGNQTVSEGSALTFTALGTDVDIPADTRTYSLEEAAPNGASINSATGAFAWTPTEADGPGSYTFTVKVTDSGGLFASEEITVTVNEVNTVPALAAIGNQTIDEGSELTFAASATDADEPVNTLTYSLAGTVPTGASIDSATGAFSWTPTEADGPGSYAFTVKVTDDGSPSLSDSEEITVMVSEVNTAPALGAIGNKTVDEGSELTFTASTTDEDLPANSLTYSLEGTVPEGAGINASTGVFSWIPTEAQGGSSYTFTVKVTDNGGLFDSEEITVTVAKVNNAPVLAAIGSQTVNEGSELTFIASATDGDDPANTLTYSLVGAPTGAAINGSTGAFSWTPTEAQGPGSYAFTVKVMDDGSPSLSDSEEITVTVNEVNTMPVLAAIGSQTVNEGSELTFIASATDADEPANTLTYSLEGAPGGAAINGSTGEFSWIPTEAQGPGNYTFTVKVTDNGAGTLSDSEEITVTVSEANTAPVLGSIGNKIVNELTPLTFTVNATDEDEPADTLTYSLVGAPAGAAINAVTGVFSWIPTEAQGPGNYTFKVKVTDGGNPSLADEEEITVAVNEVNMAPTLDPLFNLSLSSGAGAQTVNLTGISAGGETQGIDVAASSSDTTLIPAVTVSYTSPAATGALTFTPQGEGNAIITVMVTDDGGTANGGVDTATRTFTVTVASDDSGDSGNSGGGSPTTPAPADTVITPMMNTDDDKNLNDHLAQQGAAVLDITGDADAKATLSSEVVNTLQQAGLPLTIENQGIKVEFSPAALAVQGLQAVPKDAQGMVEIGVREVTLEEKEEILAAANLGASSGLFEIGGKLVELTAQVVTTTADGTDAANKVEAFFEPVAVTIDLSGLNFTPEQIAELTGVRYEKDAAGNIVPVSLGGTFDPVTGCFTFYTDRFSYYGVLLADNLVQIHLTVDIPAATINGKENILDVAPTVISNRTMVPVRFVSEALGAEVEWLENTGTVVIRLDGKELSLVIGQTVAGMDVPAQIVNNRTMVPLHYVSEALGAYVKWFPQARKVEIIR
ncbi:MAG: putative Ig domain-containing protein [Syntrophomonadaceae bacterium]|nr:putative Ig domain-containing protein [Syntrophomonadaceae bacterium]